MSLSLSLSSLTIFYEAPRELAGSDQILAVLLRRLRIRHRSSLANIKQGSFAGHVRYFRDAPSSSSLTIRSFVRDFI